MIVKDLMRVIQVQRHDFLNHLQVISGLVQLGKVDRVRGYIERVCQDMQLMSTISRIKVPEISAAITIGYIFAAEQQIEIDYHFETDLGEADISGNVLGQNLIKIQKDFFDIFPVQAYNSRANFSIEKLKDNYVFHIGAEVSISDEESVKKLTKAVKNNLGLDNGKVEITNSEGILDIALFYPIRKCSL